MKSTTRIRFLFALFALSGFTGLIYESLWAHYLRLFLGAAAFAQSFVLAAFMGGMALGAWLASRLSKRLPNLLAAYGWAEALIGLAALAFHPVFEFLTGVSLDHVIPSLGSPGATELYKYLLCALLVVPQAVLLGMTFPLMSGALIRRGGAGGDAGPSTGRTLAMLYFTNSIGAASGVLVSAFWLLGWLGLEGTMQLGGALNLLLAAVVLGMARREEPRPVPVVREQADAGRTATLLLAAAFITGTASFIYEIVWIRMLSLVLGASFQAFELMLSAFITGLALGGLWVRKRIDRYENPVRIGGIVQIAMGIAALATVFVYHFSFDWMAWFLGILQREARTYPLFNLFSHAIAFAVMLPATFLAGMTLPLFTNALLRGGRGERAIGQVYAANTLGAIAGVLIAMHVLLPEFGVKLALVLGAVLDLLLGAWLLRRSGVPAQRFEGFAALLAGLLAAAFTARASVLDPQRLSSGVFRQGAAEPSHTRVAFYRDGKTASIAVLAAADGTLSILTNGKPDASIRLNPALPAAPDEQTMAVLGALPLLLNPAARSFANIGFGSGLTGETILSHGAPRVLDTIELEPAMIAGARRFAPRVIRPFEDPRSRVHIEDAKSFFARHGARYDVIVSEPSNPWVNGAANLFTTEFYRSVKKRLAPRGLFVQWIHSYEFDDRLLGSVLAALAENFPDVEIYEGSADDLVIVAAADGRIPALGELPDGEPAFMAQLARVGITKREHLAVRRLSTGAQAIRLLAPLQPPVNSDYRPFVQLQAARARFAQQYANAVPQFALAPLPINEMLGGAPPEYLSEPAGLDQPYRIAMQSRALALQRALLDPGAAPSAERDAEARTALLALRQPAALCGDSPSAPALAQLHVAAALTLAHLGPEKRRLLWTTADWLGCPHGAMSQALRDRLAIYRVVSQRDAEQMHLLARALLAQRGIVDPAWHRFVLLTGMLGAHASGRSDAAQQLWREYGTQIFGGGALLPYVRYVANWRNSAVDQRRGENSRAR